MSIIEKPLYCERCEAETLHFVDTEHKEFFPECKVCVGLADRIEKLSEYKNAKCKYCDKEDEPMKILEHSVLEHNDKEAANVLEALNSMKGR